jgi:hypothetical protein
MNLRTISILVSLLICFHNYSFGQVTGAPYIVNAVPNPIIGSFSASSTTINSGGSTSITPVYTQGTASIDNGVGSVVSSNSYSVSPTVTTTYTLTVTNSIGKSVTQTLTIYVNSVVINTQPISATVNVNSFNSMTVAATGSGILSYQWYDANGSLSGYVSDTYRSNTAGSFHVVVTSTLNGLTTSVTSNTATVTHNSVAITAQPTNGMIGTGGTYQIAVTGTGSGSLSYQWYKGSNAITGATSSTYSATAEDAYYVEVTSTLNSVANTIRSNGIYITENKVRITSGPSDAYATSGYTTSLIPTFSYNSGASLSYQWYNGSGAVPGATSSILTTGTAGTYYLVITSQLNGTTGVATSTSATVTVVPAPVATSLTPGSSTIALGSSTTLTPVFSNGTAVINPGAISVTSGVSITVSPTVNTQYSLDVTNLAGTVGSYNMTLFVSTGTFSITGNLTAGHDLHSSILLNNGKVLIAQSYSSNLSNAQLYDPATGSFSNTGNLVNGYGRPFGAATKLSNGNVLFTGGFTTSGNNTNTAEIYDVSSGTFSLTTGSMSLGRQDHIAVLLNNGKVLISGGYNYSSLYLSSAQLFDPGTSTFSNINSMGTVRSNHTATLLNDGTVLIVGGYNSSTGYLSTAEIFNPSNNTFSATSGNMYEPRGYHTATKLNNGKVLIVGGVNQVGGYHTLQSADLYDPTTKTFTRLPSINGNRSMHTATLLNNGKVLITGGSSQAGSIYADGILFDPITNTFSTEANHMAHWRYYHAACLLPDGTVLITGGTSTNSSAEIYDPH